MVTLHHIKHKPVLSNASSNDLKTRDVYQPAKQENKMMMRLWTVTHQECHPPWLPFFLEYVELAYTLLLVDFQ